MKQIGLTMDLTYININGIPIGIYKDGPIGVGISGGADSAILLYILMCNTNQPVHIYNMWSSSRKYSFAKSVKSVIETCSKLTGNTNYVEHLFQVEPRETIELYCNQLNSALNKKEIDMFYMGLTAFPPKEVYMKFDEQQQDWHNKFRDPDVEHPLFGLTIEESTDMISNIDKVYSPFRNYNKKDIAKLYKALDLETTLFPITRSCENDNHIESHCGKCWWCQERLWAFGKLGD